MDQKTKEKIADALYLKGVKLACPRCAQLNFEVVGQTILSLNDNPNVLSFGAIVIPAAIVACSHCGFITLHALSTLGLSNKGVSE